MVRMVSVLSRRFVSHSLFSTLLGTVPRVQTAIGITVIFMFSIFFSPLARSWYLSSFFAFFYFHSVVSWNNGEIVFQNHRDFLYNSFSKTHSGLFKWHLSIWSYLSVSHTVKWFQVLLCYSKNLTSVICLHTFKLIYMIYKRLVSR